MDGLEGEAAKPARSFARILAVFAVFALGAGAGAALHLAGPASGHGGKPSAPVVVVPVRDPPSVSEPAPAADPPPVPVRSDPPRVPAVHPAGEAAPQDTGAAGDRFGEGATTLLGMFDKPEPEGEPRGEPGRTLGDVLDAAAAAIARLEASEAAARLQSARLAASSHPPARQEETAGMPAGPDPEGILSILSGDSGPPPVLPAREHPAFASVPASGPAFLLDRLPAGVSAAVSADIRKARFIEVILPLILRVNEEIREERRRVQEIAARASAGMPIAYRDAAWLARLAERYRLPGAERPEDTDFAALLKRVDVVPPSLALAQAAEESGWGTSRLARVQNALFGQTLGRDGGPGGAARFRGFFRLLDSARAYVHNLNTHGAYEVLRTRRAEQRRAGRSPDGMALAGGLHAYSERGAGYVSAIREIIRGNLLHRHDLIAFHDQQGGGAAAGPLLIPASR